MAGSSASTTLTSTGTGGKTTLSVSWSETGTSVANNTSTISVTATMTYKSAMWSVTNSGTLYAYWHDNKTNSDKWVAELSFNELGYNTNSRTASGSVTVTHKDDGTLSGYAFARWTQKSSYGGYAPSSGDAVTGWVNLTTIARASEPSIKTYPNNTPDFNIGDTITIHMNRKSSSFTHTVKINYGSTSYTIATGVTDNCTLNTNNIASSLYAQIPTATSYSNTISVTTYNGSTNIGTKTCAYNAKAVESNARPVFSNFSYQDTNSTITAITGNNQYLVQNKSSLRVSISSTDKATARYSATMKNYNASISGISASANYTTSDLNIDFSSNSFNAGSQTLSVKATDSRNYTISVSKSVNVLAYASPVINASATRLNNFENQTTLVISGSYSPLTISGNAKNTIQLVQYRYKKQSTTTWGSWTSMSGLSVSTAGTYTTTNKTLDLDNSSAYDIEIKTVDRLETKTVSLTVAVGVPIFRIGTDGNVYNNEKRLIPYDEIIKYTTHVGQIIRSTNLTTAAQVKNVYGGTWSRITDYQLVAYASLTAETTIGVKKNISTVTKSGTGTYKVTLSKAMPNTNYLAFVSGEVGGAGSEIIGVYGKTTTTFNYDFCNHSGSLTTPTSINIAVFGQFSAPDEYVWRRTA